MVKKRGRAIVVFNVCETFGEDFEKNTFETDKQKIKCNLKVKLQNYKSGSLGTQKRSLPLKVFVVISDCIFFMDCTRYCLLKSEIWMCSTFSLFLKAR